jgi:hypothetical protein
VSVFATLARRYGSDVARVDLSCNDDAVLICDPVLAEDLFGAGSDLIERAPLGGETIVRYSPRIDVQFTGSVVKQCDAATARDRYREMPARKPWQCRNGEGTRCSR